MIKNLFISIIFIILSISTAFADKSMMIGKKGNQNDVTRVIKVLMYDNYFEPSSFQVQSGETIKFEVENVGELVHEFNIAKPKMHIQHQSEMQKMVEMEILFADSSSVSNFIIGVPAHTDDSNKTFTPFSFAHVKISSP